jgi:hypothetical protein
MKATSLWWRSGEDMTKEVEGHEAEVRRDVLYVYR